MVKTDCSLVILCGGKAQRLGGVAKGLCEVGGRAMLARQLDALGELFPKRLLITNTPERYRDFAIPAVADERPGCGPLGGLATALQCASSEQVFLIGCDMPFIRPQLVRYLLQVAPQADLVAPVIDGYVEPLLSRVATRIEPIVQAQLDRRRYKMTDLYPRLEVAYVEQAAVERLDPERKSFININSLDDLAIYGDLDE